MYQNKILAGLSISVGHSRKKPLAGKVLQEKKDGEDSAFPTFLFYDIITAEQPP